MKIVSSTIYALGIPFVETFSHNLAKRHCSDSIVIKLVTDSGICGFGEGVPRPYVTGETLKSCMEHIANVLLPVVLNTCWDDIAPGEILPAVDRLLPCVDDAGGVVWHAARCAVEMAIIDGLLRAHGASLAAVLPPCVSEVTYSGVIATGSLAAVEQRARRMKAMRFSHIKIKIGQLGDEERVGLVRNIVGSTVSLRLDANGAFDRNEAVSFLAALAPYGVACIEQPIPRGDVSELAALRADTSVPLMADESLVTLRDAKELIAQEACDFFNLRLSKCGGLHNTLEIAELAMHAGVGLQLGCQVGETAILSAAGRHVAAHLAGLRFVEGSYGAHLLVEDIAAENIVFGSAGIAPLLTGPGLGVSVREDVLAKHAMAVISVQ
ncbi:MAG: enolase C-terminal domain-like protein [Patescibacteria group bacterium]